MLTGNMASALLRSRVSQLNLGWMATEAEDHIQCDYHGVPADWPENAAAGQPNGRLIDPEEAAGAVAFLSCSELGLMTGSIVNYDQSVWGGF